MMKSIKTHKIITICVVILLLAGSGIVWWRYSHRSLKQVHKPRIPAWMAMRKLSKSPETRKGPDLLRPAIESYNKGQFKDAEAAAFRVIESKSGSKNLWDRKDLVRARYMVAFCAARMKDMKLARDRFATLKEEASRLPDKGKQDSRPGMVLPTFEEDGAYQHAVCTAALGDKVAAQSEYMRFIGDYPESPLLNGVMMRLRLLNDGKMPKEAEKAWRKAQDIAQARQKERQRDMSLCGPECLAELLKRKGEKADVESLSKEMKTSDRGTSLQMLSGVAKKHGFTPKGLKLTQKGLEKQKLPLIALMQPGHYVIVDVVTPKEITIWDPNGEGPHKPSTIHYPVDAWKEYWSGIALILQ
jgi:hypothetical protein